MHFKLHTSVLFIFFAFVPFLTRIDAGRYLNNLELSDQQRSDLKTSKFLFSTNVIFEEGGLNEKLNCLTGCLKKTYSAEENDRKCVPTKPKKLSNQLIENISLDKPTKAAPFQGFELEPHISKYGNDGDITSFYFSTQMTNPWWIVELGDTYKVVKITFFSRSDIPFVPKERSVGIQFYVTDNIFFNRNDIPDITNLILFSEISSAEVNKTVHEVPEGHFGNRVLAIKPASNTFLEILEVQVSGYLYA